jgi:hypothetical protein
MITVLGVLALVTILVIAGFTLAQQALHESVVANNQSQAFQAANAGLDKAVSTIASFGYREADFPMPVGPILTGAGEATVTVVQVSKSEYLLVSQGLGADNTMATVRVRMYLIDLYGMNISLGARLDANASNGKVNGTTSIYGPLYTYGSLDSENLGNGSGGIKWGPLMVKGGNVSSSGDYIDVGAIYYEPPHTVSVGCTPPPRMIPSVPDFRVPPVDAKYLDDALERAQSESADNNQGEPDIREAVNTEVSTPGDTTTYAHTPAAGAVSTYAGYSRAYKVIDSDNVINKSSGGLTINSGTTSFGWATDDFAYDAGTRTLTCWGTVFIDGPLTTNIPITYVGNGVIVANGKISLLADFKPLHGLAPGLGGKNGDVTYDNQSFNKDETLGIVSPDWILLDNGGGNPGSDPTTPPSHAGAFYCVNPNGDDPNLGMIQLGTKVAVVGCVIARGIDFLQNNNQHLRTSANLGQCVSPQMPGYDQWVQSLGAWSRQ